MKAKQIIALILMFIGGVSLFITLICMDRHADIAVVVFFALTFFSIMGLGLTVGMPE